MASVHRTAPAKARSPRPVATEQGIIGLLGSEPFEDSSNHIQHQFLTSRFGLTIDRAKLVAILAWGGRNV